MAHILVLELPDLNFRKEPARPILCIQHRSLQSFPKGSVKPHLFQPAPVEENSTGFSKLETAAVTAVELAATTAVLQPSTDRDPAVSVPDTSECVPDQTPSEYVPDQEPKLSGRIQNIAPESRAPAVPPSELDAMVGSIGSRPADDVSSVIQLSPDQRIDQRID